MPPASPAATFADRIASRMLVLPWSTCPITVTTGGRGFGLPGPSAAVLERPEVVGHDGGGLEVDLLVDGGGDAVLEEVLDDVHRAHLEEVGQLADGERRRQLDVSGTPGYAAHVGTAGLEVLADLILDLGGQLSAGVRVGLVVLTQPAQYQPGLLVELPRQLTYPDSARRAAFSSWDEMPP